MFSLESCLYKVGVGCIIGSFLKFVPEDINDISNEDEDEDETSGDQFVIAGDEDDERTDEEDEEEARDVDDFSDNDGFEDVH
ncbi:hypothetical protein QQ045_012088 [Rhodiola kirilowii]